MGFAIGREPLSFSPQRTRGNTEGRVDTDLQHRGQSFFNFGGAQAAKVSSTSRVTRVTWAPTEYTEVALQNRAKSVEHQLQDAQGLCIHPLV